MQNTESVVIQFSFLPKERVVVMRKHFSIALALVTLIGAMPLLGACHATAGAGQDLSSTGKVITDSAKKNTP